MIPPIAHEGKPLDMGPVAAWAHKARRKGLGSGSVLWV